MARLLITGLPEPAADIWCAACVAFIKGDLFRLEEIQQRATAILENPDDKLMPLPVPRGFMARRQLELAVTWGPHPSFAHAIVPLCWTHVPAIDPAAAAGPEPPQRLLRGLSLWPARRMPRSAACCAPTAWR